MFQAVVSSPSYTTEPPRSLESYRVIWVRVPGGDPDNTNVWLGLGLLVWSVCFIPFTGDHPVPVRLYLCSYYLIFTGFDSHPSPCKEVETSPLMREMEVSTSAESSASHSTPDPPPLILTARAPSLMFVIMFLCSQLLGSACSEVPGEHCFDLGARWARNWSEDHLQVLCVPWWQASQCLRGSPGPLCLCCRRWHYTSAEDCVPGSGLPNLEEAWLSYSLGNIWCLEIPVEGIRSLRTTTMNV